MLKKVGRSAIESVDRLRYAMGFFALVLKESLLFLRRGRVGMRVLVMQILFTGVEALGIAAAMALAIGAAINLIGSSLLTNFGQGKMMYTILIAVITRELGPLLTAFIVIARSGTAIATELGGMAVDHELEAYVSVGVDPISYLAAPRFLGVVASILALYVYFNIFGLLGSFVVVQLIKPIAFGEYFGNLAAALAPGDFVSGVTKSLVFGVIVSSVSLYRGFSVERASTEIPVAGIKAVGSSFMLCILADAVMTVVQYAK
jgi:ABC-type transport system involved in resistance to organic solvents, permease component